MTLDTVKKVLSIESDAIRKLIDQLDHNVLKAVELIHD